jgi:iron complex transport system permease protein
VEDKMSLTKPSLLITILVFYLLILSFIYALDYASIQQEVLREYRAYRIAYALIAGGILGACGVFLQSSLRNPLVDHYVLGIGSGALFAFYLSYLVFMGGVALPSIMSIAGGLLSLFLTIGVAERISGSEVSYVLSGLAINSLFSGFSMMLSYIVVKVNPYASFYLVGSFVLATKDKLPLLILPIALVVTGYIFLAKPLNAIMIGDLHAKQVGYDPRLTRLTSVIVGGVASSIVVSLFGLLGFIGLVSPHISRLLLRTGDNRLVIPASFAIGSMVVYSTDLLSRKLLASFVGEVPAGAIASMIGAPFFLIVLLTRLKGRAS